jgi:hypothetical protein
MILEILAGIPPVIFLVFLVLEENTVFVAICR